MNYESIEQLANSQEAIYVAVGAASAVAGYLAHAVFGRGARKMKMAQITRDTKAYEAKIGEFVLERDKLKYANADSDLSRKLQEEEVSRKYELEDHARERNEQKADHDLDNAEKRESSQTKHNRRMEIASKLADLKPVLQQYIDGLKQSSSNGPDYLKERMDYQRALIDEALKYLRAENENGVGKRLVDDENIISDDAECRLRSLVDLAYPLSEGRNQVKQEIPREIATLINLLFKEDTSQEEDEE